LGLVERLHTDSEDNNLRANLRTIANSLVELYNANQTPDWKWFENILSYDNPRLSQALFAAHEALSEKAYLGVAEESMKFLKAATTIDGIYVPIGSGGWYPKDGDRALYDQQPIEAGGMVETAALAYNLTPSDVYASAIRQAMGWFFGLNTKSVELYDDSTGACYDGINHMGVNENQGSESTLAFLLAAVTFIGIFQNKR
jgi:hypothetical protein